MRLRIRWLSVAYLLALCFALFVRDSGVNTPLVNFVLLGWPAMLGVLFA